MHRKDGSDPHFTHPTDQIPISHPTDRSDAHFTSYRWVRFPCNILQIDQIPISHRTDISDPHFTHPTDR